MESRNLDTAPISKLLLKYSIPAIIAMVINGLYNVVDRIFIGNIPEVGPIAITGMGITLPVLTIVLAFGLLVGAGATANISIKLGQDRMDIAEKILGTGICLSACIGLLLTVIFVIFSDSILIAFGASDESLPYATEYMDVIAYGYIFAVMAILCNNLVRGDGNPKLSATVMVTSCCINIVLDAVFIFGFNMGIAGAAWATVIAQCFTTVSGLSYYIKDKSTVKLKKENIKLDSKMVVLIVSIGLAPFTMQLATSMVQVISNNVLKIYGGDLAIGAMTTISSVALLLNMPMIGVNQGSQPIIGFNFGAKLYDRAEATLKLSITVATIWLVISWIGIYIFAENVALIFNSNEELVEMTADGLRKYLCVMPVIATVILSANYMQAIGKAKKSMFLSLLRQVLLLIPLINILPKYFGLAGVWYAQPTADAIAFIITLVILFKTIKDYRKDNDLEELVS